MCNYFLARTIFGFACMHPLSVDPMQHFTNETPDLLSFENWCGYVSFSATAYIALRVTYSGCGAFPSSQVHRGGVHPGQAARPSLAA